MRKVKKVDVLSKQVITKTETLPEKPSPFRLIKCGIVDGVIEIDDSMTIQEWENNFVILKGMSEHVQFWIGDLIYFGTKNMEEPKYRIYLRDSV